MNFDNEMIKGISQSEFEKAFKKEYPHADYLACLKFDEVENQYKPINEEVEPPDVNFWVCVGVNTGWWAWQYRQNEVDELKCELKRINLWYSNVKLQLENKEIDSAIDAKKIDELQKRVDAAFRVLSRLNDLDDEAHKRWKREACMFSQGESNAYEHSVRLLEQALKGGSND